MSEWQPIATAPRDGTRILLSLPADDDGEPYEVARWQTPQFKSQRDGGWIFRGGWVAHDEPTHWMQIPDPPKHAPGDAA